MEGSNTRLVSFTVRVRPMTKARLNQAKDTEWDMFTWDEVCRGLLLDDNVVADPKRLAKSNARKAHHMQDARAYKPSVSINIQ